MKNNTKNIRKGITAILFATVIIASVLIPMPAISASAEEGDIDVTPPVGEMDTVETSTSSGSSFIWTQTIGNAPGMDQYRWYDEDFSWRHETFDSTGKRIISATLEIRAWDVDNPIPYPEYYWERDIIYADGHKLGELKGGDDIWSVTTFNIDPTLAKEILEDGKMHVFVDIDAGGPGLRPPGAWGVTIDWSKLTIVWEPEKIIKIVQPREGDIFWIGAEPEPAMPRIDCQAKVVGVTPDPTATTEFTWEAVITYTDHKRTDTHKFESGKVIGGAWNPDFKNVIAGGTLTIKVKAVIDDKEYRDSVTGYIRGRNPNKETIKETLGKPILQVICYKESYPKWHQFDDSGLPIFGPPGGFGLMQLDTPPPTSQQIWSWLENVKGGKTLWHEKLAMSKNYVKQVKKANSDQKVTNLFPEQHERQAAYLYRGAAWVDGEWQYYYIWNRNTKQWEVNPKGDAISIAYADDAMNIKADIIAGNPPTGW